MKRRNKWLVGALALSLTAGLALGLTGCQDPDEGGELTFEQAYDCSAISGIGLLASQTGADPASATPASVDVNSLLSQEQKDMLTKNLAIAQSMTGTDVVRGTVQTSDRDGYAYYYTVTAKNYAGEEETYKFYYNRTDVTDGDDAAEGEQEYTLNGLVILGEQEYTMQGKQEVEQGEVEFTFQVGINADTYVKIEQETEGTETEFTYSVYVLGNKVYETEVEYEVDKNGNIELAFELMDGLNAAGIEYKYEFYKVGTAPDVEYFADVKLELGGINVKATVQIVQGAEGTEYVFQDVTLDLDD